MQKEAAKIGISGGTFDPIHHGHLIAAQEIREKMGLDKIIFIPSGTPPHKDNRDITHAVHRYNMVERAVKTNPVFEASRIEIERSGYTYTIDTLTQLREIYGYEKSIYFIIGADVVWDLCTWKRFEEVFEMCEFIAVLRPGYKKESFFQKVESLKAAYNAKIHIVDAPQIEISSTIIRERVQNGKSIKYLVPQAVEEYIKEHGLFASVLNPNHTRMEGCENI